MLRKLKKAIPAVISAILCVTMVLGVTVSAEKKNSGDGSVWTNSKALTNAKYYSKYIKLASKYSEKKSKNTISYEKSRMKKFSDKFSKAASAKNPEFSLALIDKESIIYLAVKGNNNKMVLCMYNMGIASYSDGKTMTLLSVEDKIKVSETVENDKDDNFASELADEFDFGISENAKGRFFKFKSEEKIYYYEEFDTDYYVVGMLFNEKGSPLAIVVDDEVYCISFKTTVDDSEFDIPKGYKNVDIGDFNY